MHLLASDLLGGLLDLLCECPLSMLHLLGEPITFGIHPEDVSDFMRRESFKVVDLAVAEELERRYPRLGSIYPADYILHAHTMP